MPPSKESKLYCLLAQSGVCASSPVGACFGGVCLFCLFATLSTGTVEISAQRCISDGKMTCHRVDRDKGHNTHVNVSPIRHVEWLERPALCCEIRKVYRRNIHGTCMGSDAQKDSVTSSCAQRRYRTMINGRYASYVIPGSQIKIVCHVVLV